MPPIREQTAVASALRPAVVRLARRLRGERSDTSLTTSQIPGELAAAERVRRRDARLAQRRPDLPPEDLQVLRRAAVALERLAAA